MRPSHQNDTLALRFSGWPCNSSQRKLVSCQPINPKAGVPQDSVLSPLLFLIYINDRPTPHHKQNSLSQFADDTAQSAFSLNVRFAAKFLQQDLLNLAMWCAKWRIKLNPKKTKVIMFSSSLLARKTVPNLKLYGETLKSILK